MPFYVPKPSQGPYNVAVVKMISLIWASWLDLAKGLYLYNGIADFILDKYVYCLYLLTSIICELW